jgi:hypothetical protein
MGYFFCYLHFVQVRRNINHARKPLQPKEPPKPNDVSSREPIPSEIGSRTFEIPVRPEKFASRPEKLHIAWDERILNEAKGMLGRDDYLSDDGVRRVVILANKRARKSRGDRRAKAKAQGGEINHR